MTVNSINIRFIPPDNGDPQQVTPLWKEVAEKVVALFQQLYLLLCYLNLCIDDLIAHTENPTIFEGAEFVPCGNHGKRSDIPSYANSLHFNLTGYEKLKIDLNLQLPENIPVQMKPFGKGVCFGAATLCCKRWLKDIDTQQIAKEFEEGIPYEAVLLQSVHSAFASAINEEKGFKVNLLYTRYIDLFKAIEELISFTNLSKQIDSPAELNKWMKETQVKLGPLNRPEYSLIMEATAEFLSANTSLSYTDFICQKAKENNTKLTGILYSTLRWIEKDFFPQTFDSNLDFKKFTTSLFGVDLTEKVISQKSISEASEAITTLQPGTYILELDVEDCEDSHAVAMKVTENGQGYVLEPNYGVNTTPIALDKVVRRIFEQYNAQQSTSPITLYKVALVA